MFKFRKRLAALIGIAGLVGLMMQATPSHGEPDNEPTAYYVVFPRRIYQQSAQYISQVDFRNFVVDFYGPDGKRSEYSPKLVDGRSIVHRDHPWTTDDVALVSIYYLDFTAGTAQPQRGRVQAKFAVTVVWWVSEAGSSSQNEALNLYEVLEGKVALVEQIDFDPAAEPSFDITAGKLTIKANNYGFSDGICSPPGMKEVTFNWTGHSFKEQTSTTVPCPKSP